MEEVHPERSDNSFVGHCEIIQGGVQYFDRMMRLIESAQESIYLLIYIFNDDSIGRLIQEALVKASHRGVKVILLLDGIGSRNLTRTFLQIFDEADIEVNYFSKIYFKIPFRIGRRLHAKLIVADRVNAMLGGINIADKYLGTAGERPWLDFGVYVEGVICEHLENVAIKILERKNFKDLRLRHLLTGSKPVKPKAFTILENDAFKNKLQIRKSYLKAFTNARKNIILFASYFLPNFKLLRILEQAAARGVRVLLILPGEIDVRFYKTAVKYLYPRLLEKNIVLYEYPLSIMHAKVAVIDRKWATVGSYNLNDLSDLLSVELNLEIRDQKICQSFEENLLSIIDLDCKKVDKEPYKNIGLLRRWKGRIYYSILRYSLRLIYWLTDKNNDFIKRIKRR